MARDFNGTTDRIDYTGGTTTNTGPITVSAWINPDTVANAASRYVVSLQNTTPLPTVIFWCTTLDASGIMRFQRLFGGATSAKARISTASFTAGAWQHICGVDTGTGTSGSEINMYRNGTNVDSASTVDATGSMDNTNGTWSLGGRTTDDLRNWDGQIAEVGIWNVALSTAEIASLATGVSPLRIRPASLIFYAPVYREQKELTNGWGGTLDGTTVTAHPRTFTLKR